MGQLDRVQSKDETTVYRQIELRLNTYQKSFQQRRGVWNDSK